MLCFRKIRNFESNVPIKFLLVKVIKIKLTNSGLDYFDLTLQSLSVLTMNTNGASLYFVYMKKDQYLTFTVRKRLIFKQQLEAFMF